ncbi:LOW QUALITY PROTEIN: run domain Beclin-1-interacting and cysteine-rich domain-containing protein-like [Lethenteron reissneri]|uniref:LOW QUALITY PROTEIN: run domain Beclin-1-interacting and cysteine-rich domain-containing protein-like n=1 Tax=Lethenteron reissneri TaxID=7753 RepID=UPI002AB7B3C4|nr:LOW QUALITY PROTEIN: run domain Beclin-1-interacting and cysteine-rich domain-containing protein-like [Lethenteron reissneri]
MDDGDPRMQCCALLSRLSAAVGRLLLLVAAGPGTGLAAWGPGRVGDILHGMLGHGLRDPQAGYLELLRTLERLCPDFSPIDAQEEELEAVARGSGDASEELALRWLGQALRSLALSRLLHPLLLQPHPVASLYAEHAFARSVRHVTAMLLCLGALEDNNPGQLAMIDPATVGAHATWSSHLPKSHSLMSLRAPVASPSPRRHSLMQTSTAVTVTVTANAGGNRPSGSSKQPATTAAVTNNPANNNNNFCIATTNAASGSSSSGSTTATATTNAAATTAATTATTATTNATTTSYRGQQTSVEGRTRHGRSRHVRSRSDTVIAVVKPPLDRTHELLDILAAQHHGSCADLDKENAHFSLSDALMAVIELIKCSSAEGDVEPGRTGEAVDDYDDVEDEEDDDEEDEEVEEEEEEEEVVDGLDAHSNASPRSRVMSGPDLLAMLPLPCSRGSARSVATQLLRHLQRLRLPGATAQRIGHALLGQQALCLDSTSADEQGESGGWKPPPPQIIFHMHPKLSKKEILTSQHHRCAGCGRSVEPGFLGRVRYCEYSGGYFCACCHVGSRCALPARVLRRWDFSTRPVSEHGRELLTRAAGDPLCDVARVNPGLYARVRALRVVRDLREQLFHMKNLLKTCRLATRVVDRFDEEPGHLSERVHLYSLRDLLHVKSGELAQRLAELVHVGLTHVNNCEVSRNQHNHHNRRRGVPVPGAGALSLGNLGQVCVCARVTSAIHLIDPGTLQGAAKAPRLTHVRAEVWLQRWNEVGTGEQLPHTHTPGPPAQARRAACWWY